MNRLNIEINYQLGMTPTHFSIKVGDTDSQKGKKIIEQSIEALKRTKKEFANEYARYTFRITENGFFITVYYKIDDNCKGESTLDGDELFPVDLLEEFCREDGILPDDLTEKQEIAACKVIISKIGEDFNGTIKDIGY